MPELPEVEALARFLDEKARGAEVARIDVVSVAVLKTFDPPVDALAGHAVAGAWRRGKFLVLDVGPLHLVLHLARAGWVRWHDALKPAAGARRQAAAPGLSSGPRPPLRSARAETPSMKRALLSV